ncbi:MAG: MATE family efflux transporter [Lachnospiraceae bacterium]|nr:MATE family efflux transporter [Lachnospiraceae bacterium]
MASSTTNAKGVGRDLTEGPIFSTLIVFAWPIILANVIQQLYGMVDLAVVGQFVGSIGTVGVNTGGEMADLMLPIGMGLGTAAQIYIAQLMGAKDHSRTKETVSTLLTFSTLLSIVLAVVMIVFSVPILNLLNCPEEAMGQASAYMIITAIGYPFIFGYNCVCGLLRGMGESKRPLYFIIVAAVINIFADILFVAVFKMEAAGTALATVLSQIGAFAASFYYLYRCRDKFDLQFDRSFLKMDPETLKVLVKLSIPQIARSLMVRLGLLYINANINAYGTEVSATNGVGNKLQKFLEVFMQGVDTASASMIGQNLGAKKTKRAGQVTWCTLAMTMSIAAVISVIGVLFGRQLFGIFSNDELVLAMGKVYMEFMVIHFFSSAFVGAFQAMVTGCGFVSLGFAIGLLDGVVCKIGLSILFLPLFNQASGVFAFFCNQIPDIVTQQVMQTDVGAIHNYGYLAYFLGIACSRIVPGLLCFGYFLSGKWKTRELVTKKK